MRKILTILLLAAVLLSLAGCGGAAAPSATPTPAVTQAPTATQAPESTPAPPELPGLTFIRAMEKEYAVQFDVYYYEGGYKYLTIGDGNRYLIVPEGKDAPAGLDEGVRVLHQPLKNIYLAATASMSLFCAFGGEDAIALSSLAAEDWLVEAARAAMERGDIVYGGKYSEPDYELLVNSDCSLAIENTMILHSPKVIEMIEMLGVPVFIDYSSYEPHPLGRTEWMKLYGAMLDREEAASAAFTECTKMVQELKDYPNTGKTVAVFLIDTSGKAQVRSSDDYLSKIIEIGGGKNAFTYVTVEDSGRTNVNMTMEEFYANAMDVDYLIYNASAYSSGVDTLDKLLEKSALLADCKAVREGHIYWIGGETYQRSDRLGDLIYDVHRMLTGEDDRMEFIHRME